MPISRKREWNFHRLVDVAAARFLLVSGTQAWSTVIVLEHHMHISSHPIRRPENESVPRRGPLFPVIAFALCSILAMAGTIALRKFGMSVPWCGEDTASACIGP